MKVWRSLEYRMAMRPPCRGSRAAVSRDGALEIARRGDDRIADLIEAGRKVVLQYRNSEDVSDAIRELEKIINKR